MLPRPKRPWYQFSLRTMFVLVTIVSIHMAWVSYSFNWFKDKYERTQPADVVPLHSREDNPPRKPAGDRSPEEIRSPTATTLAPSSPNP